MTSFLDVRVILPLVRYLRESRIDVLHCHQVRANLYGRVVAAMAGTRALVCTVHAVHGDDYLVRKDLKSWMARQVEKLTKGAVGAYTAVSGQTAIAAAMALELDSSQICVVYNGFDVLAPVLSAGGRHQLRRELGLRPNSLVVGSAGMLEPRKNYRLLIEAASVVCRECEGAEFVVLGEGRQRYELEQLASEKGLADRFHFPGFRTDILTALQALDVFALPSSSEGLSIALLQALGVGLPCVVTDVGGNPEAVRHGVTGFVVPAGDRLALASSITSLLGSASKRRDMGRAALNDARERFSASAMAARYADLYRRLAAPRNP